jgi:2-aminoadipate transaminase
LEPFLRINLGSDYPHQKLTTMGIAALIGKQIKTQSSFSGCRLPPVRVLAHQLGVSKNTIQSAYEELKSQGLIESVDRKGLFVAASMDLKVGILEKHVPETKFKDIPKSPLMKRAKGPKDKSLNLTTVFIDPRLLPKKKLSECFRSVLKSPGLPDFPELQGFAPLREKIAGRLRKRGISAEADHIVITCGSQHALDLVSRTVSSPIIATENPAYYLGKALLEMNGKTVIGLPIQPFGEIDLKEWERLLAAHKPAFVYLTSNFQNPTGYSYSTSEVSQILEWSRKYGFGILEDDWGSEMLSFSEFRPSLRTLGGENVLYMNSFTKKLLPSLRIGYLLASENSVDTIINAKRASTAGVPAINELALFEFLDRGYYDQHLKKLQTELDERYKLTLDLLRDLMPESVRWTTPGGGPCLWLELPKKVSIPKLVADLEPKKIILQPSDSAFVGEVNLHGLKIGYAYLTPEEMTRSLELLSAEIKRQL